MSMWEVKALSMERIAGDYLQAETFLAETFHGTSAFDVLLQANAKWEDRLDEWHENGYDIELETRAMEEE